ncbi:MFS transporter [Leucobacter komagatae]|uniref:MFS transporter n=1 Tax=Leucobacter komagatae TaxID=55969 RepID=A0A0D0H5C6_9MICO|nr:MFS transporter [Leucobacter komagatae]KIP52370.1 hypothetical protein SD72_10075 [Leucobacter komagatae]
MAHPPKHTAPLGYWLTLLTVFTALALAAIPSPLYDVWRAEMRFSIGMQSVIFGVYAITLIPALLVGSRLSAAGAHAEWYLLVSGLTACVLASTVFMWASTPGLLVAGRGLQGVAVGLVNAAATNAALRLEPRRDSRRASVATAVSVAAGLAAGALGSGVLAEFTARPTRLAFMVHIGVTVVVLVLLLIFRSTVTRPAHAQLAGHTAPLAFQWSAPLFTMCCVSVMAAWALGATFLAVGPSYAGELLTTSSFLVTGGTVAVLFAFACAAEVGAFYLDDRRNLTAGLGSLALGATATSLSFFVQHPVVLGIGAIFSGAGLGLVFVSTLAIVNGTAPQHQRRRYTAIFLCLLFLANSLPVMALGRVADVIGLPAAIAWFAGAIVLCAVTLLALFRRPTLRALPQAARSRG